MEGMIISVDELHRRLGEIDLVLVDCNYSIHEYRRAHIPSAIMRPGHSYIKTGDEENPGIFLPTAEEFKAYADELGITEDTTVVAYDSDGSLFAARFLWILLYYGHTKVKLLDGGWQAWIGKGLPVSVKVNLGITREKSFICGLNSDLIIRLEELVEKGDDLTILDVRSHEEYVGDDSRGNLRSGRIPGSIHTEWTEYLTGNSTREDICMVRSDHVIQELVPKGSTYVTYCQGGVRAALVAYVLLAKGYTNVRLYDGSMKDWANKLDTPLE